MRVAVLGAGPAGLSIAKYLGSQPNTSVCVIEKAEHIGGLQRSFGFDGMQFDVGTILYFQSHGLLDAFPFLRELMVPIQYRPISITPKLRYDRYPFSLSGFCKSNGLPTTIWAFIDLLLCKARYFQRSDVGAYAKYYMGSTLYEKSGLRNYIHRLHGIPDCDLDIAFAKRRLLLLERRSLRSMFFAAIRRKRGSVTGPRLVRPEQGFDYMYDRIRADLASIGVPIRTSTIVESVRSNGGCFRLEIENKVEEYDRVVSTIPIPSMLRLLGEEPKVEINCKSLLSLFYRKRIEKPGNTFFNFTLTGKWKRITVFSRFYRSKIDEDYFTVEITADEELSNRELDNVRREFEAQANELGLVCGAPEFLGYHMSANAYPIYRRSELVQVEMEKNRLKDLGIDLLGRQGNFEYVLSDMVAKRAKLKAESEASSRSIGTSG